MRLIRRNHRLLVLMRLVVVFSLTTFTTSSPCYAKPHEDEDKELQRQERQEVREAQREERHEARREEQQTRQVQQDARRQEQAAQQEERRETRQEAREAQRETQRETQAARQEERRQERAAQQEAQREVRQEARVAQRDAQREVQAARREERQQDRVLRQELKQEHQDTQHEARAERRTERQEAREVQPEERQAERDAKREERIRVAQAMPHVARSRHGAHATDGMGEVQDLTQTLRQLRHRGRAVVEQGAELAPWAQHPQDTRGQGNMGQPDMRDPYGFDKDSGREGADRGRPIDGEEPVPTVPAPEPAPEDPTLPEPPLEDPVVEPEPSEPGPTDEIPVEPVPTDPLPTEPPPVEPVPSDDLSPTEPPLDELVPQDPAPVDTEPVDPPPDDSVPTEPTPDEPVPTLDGVVSIDMVGEDYLLHTWRDEIDKHTAWAETYGWNDQLRNLISIYERQIAEREALLASGASPDTNTSFPYDAARIEGGSSYSWYQPPSETLDYTMNVQSLGELEGSTLLVTTSLTVAQQYDSSGYAHDPGVTYHLDAGEVIGVETQEVVVGADGSYELSYAPSISDQLAWGTGTLFTVTVTVTEPVSGQSYTYTHDRQVYLYRCPYGIVYDHETGEPIAGATVTVHNVDGSVAVLDKAANPNVNNPQVTDATGRYNCKLAIGKKYYLQVVVPGYAPYQSQVFSERWHIVREDVGLTPSLMLSSK